MLIQYLRRMLASIWNILVKTANFWQINGPVSRIFLLLFFTPQAPILTSLLHALLLFFFWCQFLLPRPLRHPALPPRYHLPQRIRRPQSHLHWDKEPKCPWVKGDPRELMAGTVWLMGKKHGKIRQMVWANFITKVTAWRRHCIT